MRFDAEGFPKRLKAIRHARGMTQGELAEKSGITQTTICHYEKGVIYPSLYNFTLIANALDTSADILVGTIPLTCEGCRYEIVDDYKLPCISCSRNKADLFVGD